MEIVSTKGSEGTMSTYERHQYYQDEYPKGYQRYMDYKEIDNQITTYGNVRNLMQYFTLENITIAYWSLENVSPGIDGVTKKDYRRYPWWVLKKGLQQEYNKKHPYKNEEIILYDNLEHLIKVIQSGNYEFKPVRRVYIDKPNSDEKRPLGIPVFEDKLVEVIVNNILIEIYDPLMRKKIFLNNSYGFREYRNAHMALARVYDDIIRKKLIGVIELDITKYFDNIDRGIVLDYIEEKIKDKAFMNLIRRSLNRGYMEKGNDSVLDTGKGIAQGSIIGPMLANIYRHYVLDSWFEQEVKTHYPQFSKGDLISYADDVLILLPESGMTSEFLELLDKRLTEYKLEVSKEKTNEVDLSFISTSNNKVRFLGFEMKIAYDEYGREILDIKIDSKRINGKKDKIVKCINSGIEKHVDTPLRCGKEPKVYLINRDVNRVLRGYYNYYGIDTNIEWLREIHSFAVDKMIELVYWDVLKDVLPEQRHKIIVLNKVRKKKIIKFNE
jgi:group II intron reverse transcriptase/maturase